MKRFSEALDKALEEVVETRVSERIDHLNSVIEAQKEEIEHNVKLVAIQEEENLALKIENDNLRAVNLALTEFIDRARDMMNTMDDEFNGLLRATRDMESTIESLTRELDQRAQAELMRAIRKEGYYGKMVQEYKRGYKRFCCRPLR